MSERGKKSARKKVCICVSENGTPGNLVYLEKKKEKRKKKKMLCIARTWVIFFFFYIYIFELGNGKKKEKEWKNCSCVIKFFFFFFVYWYLGEVTFIISPDGWKDVKRIIIILLFHAQYCYIYSINECSTLNMAN